MKLHTLASGLALAGQAAAFFVLPCARPVVVERADPIVNPGALSGHLHTVMGGNGFNFTMDYDRATNSACSTCRARDDLSNYWIPNLFYHREDGKFESVSQVGGMLVYYLQRQDPQDIEFANGLVAFPEGFQMLAGNPHLRSFHNTLEQRAISYACLGVSGPETHELPNHNCPNGLRVQVLFPSCWDGVNLDSPDHKSHMAYPSLVDNGVCPPSHPKRTATLFFEVTFRVDDFKDRWWNNTQPFVFSHGDPTGYGLHGDFLNGWNVSILQQAITNCTDSSGDIEKCTILDLFDQETMQSCWVPTQVDEIVSGTLDKLPGCNPVQYGPANARQQSGCDAPTQISAPKWPYMDVTQSHGFKYRGCAKDANGRSRTLDGPSRPNDDMTIESCVQFCADRGYKFAGLEYQRECYCGNEVAADRAPIKGIMGVCELPCMGNDKEICGGYGGLSLYEKCAQGQACENAVLM